MNTDRRLHWTQRLALIQHNLHAACRTGNFNFFSNIQSAHFLNGRDYVTHLSNALGDEADKLFSVLENLNAGIAWAHEDAFRSVFEKLKDVATNTENCDQEVRKRMINELQESIPAEHTQADAVTDKMMSSAVTLIQQHPPEVHDIAANNFMLGTTFVADGVQICVQKFRVLEECIPNLDIARAESAHAMVRFAISAAVSAHKGVFNMMESHNDPAGEAAATGMHSRRASTASTTSSIGPLGRPRTTSRESSDQATGLLTASNSNNNTSINGGGSGWNVLRRVSVAFQGLPSSGRKSSAAPGLAVPNSSGRSTPGSKLNPSNGLSHSSPDDQLKLPPTGHKRGISLPVQPPGHGTQLSPIAGTPMSAGTVGSDQLKNPFERSFAKTKERKVNFEGKDGAPEEKDEEDLAPTESNEKAAEEDVALPVINDKAWEENQEVTRNVQSASPSSVRFEDAPEEAKFVNDHAVMLQDRGEGTMSPKATGVKHGRRRSSEIREPPPDLESLRLSSVEAGVAV